MSMKRAFHVVYTVLALNFILPTMTYIVDPASAVAGFASISELFGVPYTHSEDSVLWWVLGTANVATLGFCCVLLQVDLQKWFPVLTPLVFLKACASVGFAAVFVWVEPLPSYLAASVFDAVTVLTMVVFAVAAKRELDCGVPGLHNLILRRPDRVKDRLERLREVGQVERLPNLWQVTLGGLYMRYRTVFRSETIGVGDTPCRSSLRARLLDHRVVRAPFLLWERVIAPFELTGLSLEPDFLERHLLGAHHVVDHGLYDLQMLSLYPGRLEGFRAVVAEVAEGRTRRARWLQDLCVYEGYHVTLLGLVDRALAGDFVSEDSSIPSDASLAGFLAWCSDQPRTPAETVVAWRSGRFTLDPRRPVASLLGRV